MRGVKWKPIIFSSGSCDILSGNSKTHFVVAWEYRIELRHKMLVDFQQRCNGCQRLEQQPNGRPLLKCGSCHAVRYCSVSCQRQDWKSGHRQVCHPDNAKQSFALPHKQIQRSRPRKTTNHPPHVANAWKELSHILATSSTEQVQQDFCIATDLVQDETSKLKASAHYVKRAVSPHQTSAIQSTATPSSSLVAEEPRVSSNNVTTLPPRLWDFVLEDLFQISCYQILLRPVHAHTVRLESLQITTRAIPSSNNTLVCIAYEPPDVLPTTLRIELEKDYTNDTTTRITGVEDNQAILVRLSYPIASCPSEPWTMAPSSARLPLDSANRLACASCRQFLWQKPLYHPNGSQDDADTIQRVLPLPSGHWDEMQDYLVCFEGQATVDFGVTSTLGQRGLLLEDETIVVAHRLDIGDVACVLAIAGYGTDSREEEQPESESASLAVDASAAARGRRPWRDAVGGATLTCSRCASHLGFAPMDLLDTYRLLKHRILVLPKPSQFALESYALQSISTFVAHEMVRHAETKAIFNFAVYTDNAPAKSHHALSGSREQCVLRLCLVSWTTIASSSHDASFLTMDSSSSGVHVIPQWKKRCKILYSQAIDDSNDSKSDSQWTWTDRDWCCPDPDIPMVPKTGLEETNLSAMSCIRLVLSTYEFTQLSVELEQSSQWYAQEAVAATMAATWGRELPVSCLEQGLACIAL
jgi:HECT-like Ubiquitin-conjugating enzyme (E2)-binding/MYND finger